MCAAIDTECYEKVVLFLRAFSLPKIGTFSSRMDAFAVILRIDAVANRLVQVGHTEVIKDNCNPDWTTTFTVNYHFEVTQEFLIRVYHYSGSGPLEQTEKHTFLGEARCFLSNLMCTAGQRLQIDLGGDRGSGGDGRVEVKGETMHHTRDNFVATFACNKLHNKDGFFNTSNPFLRFYRCNEDSSYTLVWTSNPIDSNLNPRWQEKKIPMTLLCNGDQDRPLRVEIWDHDKRGHHTYMGQVDASVRTLVDSKGSALNVIDVEKQKRKGAKYVNSGTFHATYCHVEENPSFVDYISGGMELALHVAIDFTASNGNPMDLTSLHHNSPDPNNRNPYQQAITAVGSVLEPYDTDKMYPVYGFGAKLRGPDGKYTPVLHAFPVYGGGVEAEGIDGILQAYKDCLPNIMLSGPTLFGPIVRATHERCVADQCSQEKQHYTILLIITDGVINDFESTKAAIVQAASDAMSIIIIGVGSADFTMMHQLDGDEVRISHNGVEAARDIVQFVNYNEVIKNGMSHLSEEVLQEVPNQVLQFMKQKKFKPNEQRPAPGSSAAIDLTAGAGGAGTAGGAGGAGGALPSVPGSSMMRKTSSIAIQGAAAAGAVPAPARPAFGGPPSSSSSGPASTSDILLSFDNFNIAQTAPRAPALAPAAAAVTSSMQLQYHQQHQQQQQSLYGNVPIVTAVVVDNPVPPSAPPPPPS